MGLTRQARLISIDGSDCTGKSTLTQNLSDRFTQEGHKVKVLHFPRYDTPVGKLIKAHLSGEFKMDVGAFQYLYIADQMDYTRNGLVQDMDEYDYIIFDRYKDSSLVYFMANKPRNFCTKENLSFYSEDMEHISEEGRQLKDAQAYICEPDYKIILHAKEEVLQKRLDEKEKDVHESDFDFMKNVNSLYRDLTRMFPGRQYSPTMTIDVSDKTAEEVLLHVDNFIKEEEGYQWTE